MTAENGIRVENIYYMLAYAFQALSQGEYAHVKDEQFDNAEDLFGEILSLGMSGLLKRGLHRTYVEIAESMSGLRGRVDIVETMRHKAARSQLLGCVHDEFSANNIFNKILKTTACMLIRSGRLHKSRYRLKRAVLCFSDVDEIDAKQIRWSSLRYQKNNLHYVMLMNICRFVIDGMLMSDGEKGGNKKIRHIKYDELKLSRLYENFICSYYARHYRLGARAKEIDWAVDDAEEATHLEQLPAMRSDVVLSGGDKVLIIDAKFYKVAMQDYYQHHSVNSANFYQIFAYVSNAQMHERNRKVSGMLLYAKTDEKILPDLRVSIAGKDYAARTLDLALPFKEIAAQLDGIVTEYFGTGWGK